MAIVQGSNGKDVISWLNGATGYNDTIFGYNGDDSLYGLNGNDALVGGQGADRLDGGNGIDSASYYDSSAGVIVSLLAGLGFGGTAQGDTLLNIENLNGSDWAD